MPYNDRKITYLGEENENRCLLCGDIIESKSDGVEVKYDN